VVAAVDEACRCPSEKNPHFSQNFAPAESAAPQLVQKLGAAMAGMFERSVPQAVQKDCPFVRNDPHLTQAMLMIFPQRAGTAAIVWTLARTYFLVIVPSKCVSLVLPSVKV
jgi:hypothetical protein